MPGLRFPLWQGVARDLNSGAVHRLGKKSYGSGVALRDGTFAILALGEDGGGPAELWSWDPATNRTTEMLTASFTSGRAVNLVTDGVDLFVEDDGTGQTPTWRIWKVDMTAKRATALHQERYRHPQELMFLGADHDALYLLEQSPPTLRTLTKAGREVRSVALDVGDGNPAGDSAPSVFGGVTENMIYLTSPSGRTMVQIDKRTGAALSRTPAPNADGIFAHAVDACYVYFTSGDSVSRVPRARPAW